MNLKQHSTIFNNLKLCLALLFAALLFAACGSNAGVAKPTGPNFSVTELSSIRIDQLRTTGGIDDDEDGVPEIAVYVRCDDSDIDVLCAGADQGLDIIKKDATLYGRIDAPFVKVNDTSIENCFNVKIVVVEKDSDNCPAPINADDDELFVSPSLTLDTEGSGTLLKNKIANADSSIAAYLIGPSDPLSESIEIEQTPLTENKLVLDQLYFKSPVMTADGLSFKLSITDNDAFNCSVSFSSNDVGISKEDIIYGNLNLPLLLNDNSGNECVVTADDLALKVTVALSIEGVADPILSQEQLLLSDLIDDGEKVELGTSKSAFIALAKVVSE